MPGNIINMQNIESEDTKYDLPPGSLGWPLIGESLQFISNPEFAQDHYKKYGNIFITKLFGTPTVFVSGGEAVKFVLSNENKYFQAYPVGNVKSLLGEYSLSLQTGKIHQERRRLLIKAFSPRRLLAYQNTIQDITEEYLNKWSKMSEFKWYHELRRYTFDIACKYLISIDHGSATKFGEYFKSWSKGLFAITPPLPFTNSRKALVDREKLLKLLDKIIKKRLNSTKVYDDALFHLMNTKLDDGGKLPLEEVKHQILLLLFAGHETLTSSLSSLCINLSLNPNVLNSCREEQDRCFKNNGSIKLSSMPYLDKVLLESMRIVPSVGAGFRKVIQACNLSNYRIEKDWLIFYHILLTHQNPEVYEQTSKFNPDNFNPIHYQELTKSSNYIPFGGGIRECIGKDFAMLEMKIFASSLISNCEWELIPNQNLEYNLIPVPNPKDGLIAKLWMK